MATQRTNASQHQYEKPLSPAQSNAPPPTSDTTPAVPANVIIKLLGFTAAMIIVPIGSYFLTLPMFNGNATYSGAFAAVMANVVLIAYIIVAMREDEGDDGAAQQTMNMSRGVGGRVEGKKVQ